jgi:PAS domain S-box-containing protein/putative nucleotidyltransferase with HDIG domain
MKVLYVEDDPFDADLTSRALHRTAPHFHLDIARTQGEAVDFLERCKDYDLLLTDLRLPDGSGFALLSYVRERKLDIAAVVITGQGDEEIAVSVLKAGANDYLVKRENYLERLWLTLENALQRYRMEVARRQDSLRVLCLDSDTADVLQTRTYFSDHAPHINIDFVFNDMELFSRLGGKIALFDYDVLLVNYRAQELNALDLIKEARQSLGLDLPIVLIADRGDEELAVQAMRLGASDYIVKSPNYLVRVPGLLENAYHRAELQREQAALRDSEERFRRLAENAPDIIYRFRVVPRLVVDYVSPAIFPLIGYTPEEFYNDPRLAIRIVHPEDRSILQDVVARKVAASTPVNYRVYRKDGSLIWLEGRNVPILQNGELVANEGILRDITKRKESEEQIQRQLQHLHALRSIDLAITGNLNLQSILGILLDHVITQLRVDAADVWLYDPAARSLEYSFGEGFDSSSIQHLRLKLGDDLAGKAAMGRRTAYVPDLAAIEQPGKQASLMAGQGFTAYLAAPLVVKGENVGVLEVYHRQSLKPGEEWLDFLDTLAGQAAIAIDNASLFENLQSAYQELKLAYDTTLEGWVRALDLRDQETEDHTQRVTETTLRLARVMGVDEASQVHIRRGALLHDIGKIGIPDGILRKPGPLTAEEWEVMRQHPQYAYKFLSQIDYLLPALDIPYCHHERWDGSGYPRGLKGEEIPIVARIFAVVDVWDALETDRPYRQRWPRDKVLEHIRTGSGSHFDPRVVEAFLKLIESDPHM